MQRGNGIRSFVLMLSMHMQMLHCMVLGYGVMVHEMAAPTEAKLVCSMWSVPQWETSWEFSVLCVSPLVPQWKKGGIKMQSIPLAKQ